MRKICLTSIFIIFAGMLTECSSAEKKRAAVNNKIIVSNKIETEKKISNTGKTGEQKISYLKRPADYLAAAPETISFSNNDIKVTLYAKHFAQGNGIYAEIIKTGGGSDPVDMVLLYKNEKVPLTKTFWGYRAIWGIHPEQKPGNLQVSLSCKISGKENSLMSEIMIRDVDFPVSKTMLNVGKFSDKDYTSDPKFKDLIAICSDLRKKAFSSVSQDSIGNTLAYPRDMHKITGDYWRKRIYLKYSTVKGKRTAVEGKRSFHRGVDLKGAVGSPVFAMADGVVVLSYSMFFEGKMVVIDHGDQVFSYYQHLDSMTVEPGDRVRAGDIIGGVGDTGMVTGPHLHLAFSIRGVHVDPLSILSLPMSR